ncbi:hypothetical protein [Caldiplasma sukawensis]
MNISSENNVDSNLRVKFKFGKIYFYHGETMEKRRILLGYLKDKNYKILDLFDINESQIPFPWCVFSTDDEIEQNLPKFYDLKFRHIVKTKENSEKLRELKSYFNISDIQEVFKSRFLFQIYIGIITGSNFLYIEISDHNIFQKSSFNKLLHLMKMEKITVIFSSDNEITEINNIFDNSLILKDKKIKIENEEFKLQVDKGFTIKAGSTITISCDELKLKEFLSKTEKICDIKSIKISNSTLTEIFFESSLNPDETEKIMKICERLGIEIKVMGGD